MSQRSSKRVVLIQKWVQARLIWNVISTQFYGQDYQLATIVLGKAPGSEESDDVRHVLQILDELGWEDAIFVAHSADCVIANSVALEAPHRVAGFFFVDLQEDDTAPVLETSHLWQTERVPTLVVSHRSFALPGSELHRLEEAAAAETPMQLGEVFHAFCSLRLTNSAIQVLNLPV